MQTFEEVNTHVENLPPLTVPANKTDAVANFCVYYKAVRPILNTVMNFPFFPTKWKSVITLFLGAADLMCP